MQSLPLVSVIIVTWNSEKYLPAWVIYTQRGHKLRGARRQGKQQFVTVGIILMHTFHDFEVIHPG